MSVTHLAGPVVCMKRFDRGIQRCAVCGEKLSDNKDQMMEDCPDAGPCEMLTWPVGHWIHNDGNQWSNVGVFGKGDYPDDFCLALVE